MGLLRISYVAFIILVTSYGIVYSFYGQLVTNVSGHLIDDSLTFCRCLNDQHYNISSELCNRLCREPPLWPKPKMYAHENQSYTYFVKNQIFIKITAAGDAKKFLKKSSNIFTGNIPSTKNILADDENSVDLFQLHLKVADEFVNLTLATDESYTLTVRKKEKKIGVVISASNYFGARHGLETLSQLIWKDSVLNQLVILHDITIEDKPSFSYRGLMIDTARNFFPLYQLKKVVDGMAACKLNALHLHLSDATSFPISLPSVKIMADRGAYGPNMVYTTQDIINLKAYAYIRGIRLILEVDAPSHVYQGWNANNKSLVICGEQNIFGGHLNPDEPEALNVLGKIYKDLLMLNGQNELFHIGNDEVDTKCWSRTKSASTHHDLHDFWANYTNEMVLKLAEANMNKTPDHVIMWSSPLTDEYYELIDDKENLVVEFWFGRPTNFLSHGIKVIYATVGHWYLDCGFGPWRLGQDRGSCDPYTDWKKFYQYQPWNEYGYRDQALGGEACLWTEEVGEDDLETRIWPRTAALAERLWTDPANGVNVDVAYRFVRHRERLMGRGIKAAAIWPRYCDNNPEQCV